MVTHSDFGDVHVFFITSFPTVIGFAVSKNPGDFIRENPDGTCEQHVAGNAEVAVFDFFTGDVLAVGDGTFQINATIDCDTGAFTFEQIILRGMGVVIDEDTGEELVATVKANVKDGVLKLFEFSVAPR